MSLALAALSVLAVAPLAVGIALYLFGRAIERAVAESLRMDADDVPGAG